MQAIIETIFDTFYLVTVIRIGIIMICKGHKNKQYLLFGIMAITLGTGDAFHLIPRAYALCTTGLEDYVYVLGVGKFITSITMTVFYILLYYVWKNRYQVKNTAVLTSSVYILSAIRIILSLFPQNGWILSNSSLSWGIYRNLPFAALGVLIIVLFYSKVKENNDYSYRFMWLTIVLSFVFYIPVVLFAHVIPLIGVLMIPKTCAYIWTIFIGYNDMKNNIKN